jgi:RNA polymerase sigma-70 factor (ECF subfamily)
MRAHGQPCVTLVYAAVFSLISNQSIPRRLLVLQLGRSSREERRASPEYAGDAFIAAAVQIDQAAFDALFERYIGPILTYCYYRLEIWEEAEDAAQQIFANAYGGLGTFRDRDNSFLAWLFTIAHHEVANRKRNHARHPVTSLLAADDLVAAGPTLEELVIVADRQDRVRAVLATLSSDQQRVLELRFAGLTDSEISRVLGRSPGAVRAIQARAVVHLRDHVEIRSILQEDGNV